MNDRVHFESYREQTRIKHIILEKYMWAFYTILKKWNPNMVFIDGFAGRGTYDGEDGNQVLGSPLRALETIAKNPDFAAAVSTVLFEKDAHLFGQLQQSIETFLETNKNVRPPHMECGEFASSLNKLLDGLESDGKKLAPTFLFVDPCGVSGTSFDAIQRFLNIRSCEAFIFFNIDGVRRIVGLGDPTSQTLLDLLGSEEKSKELLDRVASCNSAQAREESIIGYYMGVLKNETNAKFITPFRVESEHRRVTSHYLLHVTSHPMGFRIMKEVMWSAGQTADGNDGLELAQASYNAERSLFDIQTSDIEESILRVLGSQRSVKAEYFLKDLVEQPENLVSSNKYKEVLLKLEYEGKIQVLHKNGSGQLAGKRPKGTLAPAYHLQVTTIS